MKYLISKRTLGVTLNWQSWLFGVEWGQVAFAFASRFVIQAGPLKAYWYFDAKDTAPPSSEQPTPDVEP